MGKTIRELRQERGWTQFELALKVGVRPQAVYYWEHGRRLPLVPQLRKLAAVFGVPSDEIALAAAEADRAGRRGGPRPRRGSADEPNEPAAQDGTSSDSASPDA